MVLLVWPLRCFADARWRFEVPVGIPQGVQGLVGTPGDGVNYKGMVDATTAPEPTGERRFLRHGQQTLSRLTSHNDRLIWNDNTNVWDVIARRQLRTVDLNYVASPGRRSLSRHQCGHQAVDATNAGLMIPDQYTKLNGIEDHQQT